MIGPSLVRVEYGDVAAWIDPGLQAEGVLIAFSERTGGVSEPPYASLNLAHHVGDDRAAVDENRSRFLRALGIPVLRDRLVTAEQVHGDRVHIVGPADAGAGAYGAPAGGAGADAAGARGACAPPIAAADALVTTQPRIPLMLLFADCVPVVLAAPGSAVSVVHAGWRGALARIPEKAVAAMCLDSGCTPSEINAYIGSHICYKSYEVSSEILSQFANGFDTLSRASGRNLDLDLVVTESLVDAGVDPCRIARLGACTTQATDRFYSYRAEAGLTGRHAALACIL